MDSRIALALKKYHRNQRLIADAPRLSTIVKDLSKLQKDAARLAETLASLGRWSSDVLDPSGILGSDEGDRLAEAAGVTGALEGDLEDRLNALSELAEHQTNLIKRELPGYSRGGARDASALVGPSPRFTLVQELASIWRDDSKSVTATPTGAFCEHIESTFTKAGIPTRGVEYIVRKIASCENTTKTAAFSHGQ